MDSRKTKKLQLFSYVVLYVVCQTNGILVKYGTREGPIEPERQPPISPPKVRVYRTPAPVWEPIVDDAPDPNANWRPQSVVIQPMFTRAVQPVRIQPLQPKSAKDFVNSYKRHRNLEDKPYLPVKAKPVGNYFTPQQIVAQLGSQNVPGLGIRYFVPIYVQVVKNDEPSEEQNTLIDLETNSIDQQDTEPKKPVHRNVTPRKAMRYYENDRRQTQYIYQFPAYVPPRHQGY